MPISSKDKICYIEVYVLTHKAVVKSNWQRTDQCFISCILRNIKIFLGTHNSMQIWLYY